MKRKRRDFVHLASGKGFIKMGSPIDCEKNEIVHLPNTGLCGMAIDKTQKRELQWFQISGITKPITKAERKILAQGE